MTKSKRTPEEQIGALKEQIKKKQADIRKKEAQLKAEKRKKRNRFLVILGLISEQDYKNGDLTKQDILTEAIHKKLPEKDIIFLREFFSLAPPPANTEEHANTKRDPLSA